MQAGNGRAALVYGVLGIVHTQLVCPLGRHRAFMNHVFVKDDRMSDSETDTLVCGS